MNKLYSVHDHWTDINKKNDVDIESIDGVITGIKVNGEDYGGGGGSSDFSTATLTLIAPNGVKPTEPFPLGLVMPMISDDGIYSSTNQNSEFIIDEARNLFTIVLYKGKAYATVSITEEFIRLSGGISKVNGEIYLITGDCSIELLDA